MKVIRKETNRLLLVVLAGLALLTAGGVPAEEVSCGVYWNQEVNMYAPGRYECRPGPAIWCIECYMGGTGCWKDDDSWGNGPCGPYQQMP